MTEEKDGVKRDRSVEEMESTGKSLKAEREHRKLSLEEAARFTKIRKHFLRAIEEDKYDLLPPAFYVKGFLTVYARYLGLDPDDIVLRYQIHLKSLTLSQPLEPEQQAPLRKERISPSPLLFFVLAIIVLVTVFTFLSSNQLSEWSPSSFPSTETLLTIHGKKEAPAIHQAEQKEISTSKGLKTQETPAPEVSPFEILEASTGTGIENKGGVLIMTGKSSAFICDNQRAYFLTRIKAQREGKIVHVWLWEGKEFHRTEMEVKPPACSTYSYLTLRPQRAGNWKAEVRERDHVLGSFPFKADAVGSYSMKEKERY